MSAKGEVWSFLFFCYIKKDKEHVFDGRSKGPITCSIFFFLLSWLLFRPALILTEYRFNRVHTDEWIDLTQIWNLMSFEVSK